FPHIGTCSRLVRSQRDLRASGRGAVRVVGEADHDDEPGGAVPALCGGEQLASASAETERNRRRARRLHSGSADGYEDWSSAVGLVSPERFGPPAALAGWEVNAEVAVVR